MNRRRLLLLTPLLACATLRAPLAWAQRSDAPALQLAGHYRPGMDLRGWWVSEKYDGVRAHWDGQQLRTRGGERINAPAWFTAGWPPVPMDGELWAGRGQFSTAVSTVRQQTPVDAAWQKMRFMVFDLPAHGGTFDERIPALNTLVGTLALPWVQAVPQTKVANHAALQARMRQTVKAGGEGLMLHRGKALYQAGRSDDLLKYKLHEDAEARVVAHVPGKGKYTGMLGALVVRMPDGRQFRLGTGFTDVQRSDAPPIGSLVTYRYNGLTSKGLPRFARFMRIRHDPAPPDPQ